MFKFLLLSALLLSNVSGAMKMSAKKGPGRSMKRDFERVDKIGTKLGKANEKSKLAKVFETKLVEGIEESASYGTPSTLDYVIDISIEDSTGSFASYGLILDTGSSNTAVAVDECTNCGEGSTTLVLDYDTDYCIDVTYGSGSWSGYRAGTTDVGFVSGSNSLYDSVYLSAITSGSDFFSGDYNGIFGLAYSSLSESYYSCSEDESMTTTKGKVASGDNGGDKDEEAENTNTNSRSSGGMGKEEGDKDVTSKSEDTTGGMGNKDVNSKSEDTTGGMGNKYTNSRSEDTTTGMGNKDVTSKSEDTTGGMGNKDVTSKSEDTTGGMGNKYTNSRSEDTTGTAPNRKLSGSTTTTTTSQTPLLDSFYADGLMESDIFSISYYTDKAILALGGIDDSLYSGDITYVPTQLTMGEVYGYYLVEITDMAVDGTSLGYGSTVFNTLGGSLVDCGTTLTYIPTEVYDALETAIESHITQSKSFFEWESCLSSDDIESLPSISITLSDSLELTFDADEYLLNYEGCYYWGASSASYTILGNVIMANKFVVFDRENSQIGFGAAVSTTSSTSMLDSIGSTASMSADRFVYLVLAVGVIALVVGINSMRRNNGYKTLPK